MILCLRDLMGISVSRPLQEGHVGETSAFDNVTCSLKHMAMLAFHL